MILFRKIIIIFIVFSSSLFGLLPEGIEYKHLYLKDKTSIHLLKIDPAFFDMMAVKTKDHPLETVQKIAFDHHAIAAINASFFYPDGYPTGILKIKDRWYGLAAKSRGAIGWSETSSPFFDRLLTKVSDKNEIMILPESSNASSNDWSLATFVVGGTPLLIQNGKIIQDFSIEKTFKNFITGKHARTAIGLLENGHLIFLTADGTKNFLFGNTGLTISELASLMKELGCKEALNLDGGGSSTMVLEGQVVNVPRGEHKDHKGNYVRKVADAILILPKR